jgi:phosphopantetheinyl transferase
LLARALLRWLLAESMGTPFGWSFDAEISGRPIVRRKEGRGVPAIAISHSGEWVACVVARCGQIGIDIEVHRPGRNIMGIAGLAFGPAERRGVEREGEAAFYRIWTSREALAKARGRGLAEAADGIDRFESSSAESVELRAIGGDAWWLAHVAPVPGLSMALAFRCSVHSWEPSLSWINVALTTQLVCPPCTETLRSFEWLGQAFPPRISSGASRAQWMCDSNQQQPQGGSAHARRTRLRSRGAGDTGS